MNMMNYDRKALKERARASLRGVQPRPWKVTLVYMLLALVLPVAVSILLQGVGWGKLFAALMEVGYWEVDVEYMTSQQIAYIFGQVLAPFLVLLLVGGLLSILTGLFQAVMNYGYARYALKLYRGEQTAVKDAFSGFSMAGRAIGGSIMTGIFTFLWSLLVLVLGMCAIMIVGVASYALFPYGSEFLPTMMGLLVYVGMLVCIVVIRYRYSLTPYFIVTTDMGVMDAIRESKNAMRGNLDRRFLLDLSFLGWEALNGLIVYVVVYVGMFISLFGVGINVMMSGMDPEYMDAAAMATMLSPFFVGMCVTMLVGVLACIPLNLWLTPYKSSAEAGFFLAVTGQDDTPRTPTGFPPRPTTGTVWDNVPTAPGFTAPPTVPPAPPAPPIPPVPTGGPVGPGPNDPIPAAPEAPAEPEPPVAEPPAETPPETPAEPEMPVEVAPAAPAAENATPSEET